MSFSELTVFENLGPLDSKFLQESIRGLMTTDLFSVSESASVSEAIDLMYAQNIGAVLIVDKDLKLKGIFTERDLVQKVANSRAYTSEASITSVMTPDPTTEKSSASIAAVLFKMQAGWFRHVPIVDEDNRPIGIVSAKDMIERISLEFLKEFFRKSPT